MATPSSTKSSADHLGHQHRTLIRQLCTLESYFDILHPATTAQLLSIGYNAVFTVYKIICYDYATRFKVSGLYHLIISTFKDRWNLTLPRDYFRFFILGPSYHAPVIDVN